MKAKQPKKRRVTIRREDTVMVISGKDKGRTGRVITVDWKRERLLIEGVNMVTRHTKPNAANQKGGLIKIDSISSLFKRSALQSNSRKRRACKNTEK